MGRDPKVGRQAFKNGSRVLDKKKKTCVWYWRKGEKNQLRIGRGKQISRPSQVKCVSLINRLQKIASLCCLPCPSLSWTRALKMCECAAINTSANFILFILISWFRWCQRRYLLAASLLIELDRQLFSSPLFSSYGLPSKRKSGHLDQLPWMFFCRFPQLIFGSKGFQQTHIKTKSRNRLEPGHDMRVSLSRTEPRFDKIFYSVDKIFLNELTVTFWLLFCLIFYWYTKQLNIRFEAWVAKFVLHSLLGRAQKSLRTTAYNY